MPRTGGISIQVKYDTGQRKISCNLSLSPKVTHVDVKGDDYSYYPYRINIDNNSRRFFNYHNNRIYVDSYLRIKDKLNECGNISEAQNILIQGYRDFIIFLQDPLTKNHTPYKIHDVQDNYVLLVTEKSPAIILKKPIVDLLYELRYGFSEAVRNSDNDYTRDFFSLQ